MREQAAVLLCSCLLELQFERLSIKLSVALLYIILGAKIRVFYHTPKCFAKILRTHTDSVDCMFFLLLFFNVLCAMS